MSDIEYATAEGTATIAMARGKRDWKFKLCRKPTEDGECGIT